MHFSSSAMFVLVLLLTACSTPKEPTDSIVIFDAVIKQPFKREKNIASKWLLASDKPDDVLKIFSTSVTFAQVNGDEKLHLDCGNVKYGSCYQHKVGFAQPGEYSLEAFRIGNHSITYDKIKCGEIRFTLNPNEIHYIGGIRPPKSVSIDKGYYSYSPVFEERGAVNYKEAVKRHYSRSEKNELTAALKKKYVRELPNYEKKQIPSNCTKEAFSIF